ncbi:MAG TPA: L,D-transpeptidase, partial [Chloroflexota bacterium]|nr:L,D-transpeptidase [Chloroflexota bacterium]
MLRALGAAAGLAAVVGHPWPLPAALAQEGSRGAQEQVPDWDVPQGHFYTQTSPPDAPADSGYLVSDADGVPFWQEYRALGGPAQLGFPISSRYDADGAVYQAMQRGVLRWQGDGSPVELEPVFARLATLGFDDWLLGRGIPATAAPLAEDPELAEATRLSWLTHPQLRGAYFAGGEVVARRRFGLPMSEAERFGPYLAQRFDRAVLQLWLDEVPGQPGPGTVAAVNAGDLLWEAGLIPVPAVQPQPAPAPRPVVQVPQPAAVPAAVPAAPAAPGGGKQILVSLGGQWWYAYQDGELVYNGPVTTGRPELPTPMGRFSVIGR